MSDHRRSCVCSALGEITTSCEVAKDTFGRGVDIAGDAMSPLLSVILVAPEVNVIDWVSNEGRLSEWIVGVVFGRDLTLERNVYVCEASWREPCADLEGWTQSHGQTNSKVAFRLGSHTGDAAIS